jgi:hypothetical protein
VFDAGTTPEGQPYFVMEYVDGVPITGWSITAKDCRSAWKRWSKVSLYIPQRISFNATCRCSGEVCCASQTWPMPLSPILLSSLYGPMKRPPVFSEGWGRKGCCQKFLLDSSALISDSTSCRSDTSVPHASCKKADRSLESRSRAAPNSSGVHPKSETRS